MKGKHKKQRAPNPKVNSGSLPGKPSPVVFVIAVVSLTGIMGQNLYNQPQLKIGTTAPETIRAPYSSLIEDTKKTEAQRKDVSKRFVPVLMVDENINKQIKQKLRTLLAQGNEIRAAAGSFPFLILLFCQFLVSVICAPVLTRNGKTYWWL